MDYPVTSKSVHKIPLHFVADRQAIFRYFKVHAVETGCFSSGMYVFIIAIRSGGTNHATACKAQGLKRMRFTSQPKKMNVKQQIIHAVLVPLCIA